MVPNSRYPLCPLSSAIASLESGISVNAEDRPARPEEHGVLRVSAIGEGRFLPKENKAILSSELRRMGPAIAAGDILVSRANTLELVGLAARARGDSPNLHLSDKTWRVQLREREEGTARWLVHVINSPHVRAILRRRATGTSGSMKNIGQRTFLGICVPLPPKETRSRIADVLDAIVRRADLLADLTTATRHLKRGLMQQLISGRLRLPGFSAPWKVHRLGDLFSERTESNRHDLPLLSITADRGVVRRDELERRDTSNPDKTAYLRIAPGDIGYNTMRMWQGVSALSSLEGIVSPAYTICVPNKWIDNRFAAILFKHGPVVHLFRRYSQGLVDDTLTLRFHEFAQIRVSIPEVREQRNIAAIMAAVDAEIRLLEDLQNALQRQRSSILDKLLSGELPIPAA